MVLWYDGNLHHLMAPRCKRGLERGVISRIYGKTFENK